MPSQNENELDMLLDRMEAMLSQPPGDAIDATLRSAPRTTRTASIREHEIIREFRQEMTDGLIRLDTANQFLGLVRSVLDAGVRL